MRRFILSVGGLFVVALAVAGVTLASYSAIQLSRFERAETRRATFVYALPQGLAPGVNVAAIDLAGSLARLNYVQTKGAPTRAGEFHRTAAAWDVFLRGMPGVAGAGHAQHVRLEVRNDRIVRVTRDGVDVGAVTLEPEVLASAVERRGEEYRPIHLADAPLSLINAFLAAEDRRFFSHGGIDVRGLLRAAWANVRSGRVRQGGSTITQQLVKNRLLTPRRTLLRKLNEAWLAAVVEWRYPKERILESYLNEVYLGQRGGLAIRGVGTAARVYFGKEVHQLTLGESAVLAGMVRAPNTYSPAVNPERARERRDVVLAQMRDAGMIADGDLKRARQEPIRVPATPLPGQPAPYFSDFARQQLEERFDADAISDGGGGQVFTTVDLGLQRFGERAVARGLDRLETSVPRLRHAAHGERLQAALVAIDPSTGELRALVGGRDYQASQFDRAVLAHRQPGSAFKPFVYATALVPHGDKPRFTAASFVEDSPIELTVDGRQWSPRNYHDRYEGRVTVRRALEASLNAATVRVAEGVGLPTIIDTARAFGIESPLSPVPAMVLGAFEVKPLELAHAYLPFAAGGVSRPVTAIRAARAADGTDVPSAAMPSPKSVLTPAEAYLLTSLMEGVVRSGTAARARALGLRADVAGKTGTTNDGRDAWFVGYSPTILALVWVGFDSGEPHGLSGSEAALPIWVDFMRQVESAYPSPAFDPPAGVTIAQIDTTNGKLATPYCPVVGSEVFLTGTEPPVCDEHGGFTRRALQWWQKFRDWLFR